MRDESRFSADNKLELRQRCVDLLRGMQKREVIFLRMKSRDATDDQVVGTQTESLPNLSPR